MANQAYEDFDHAYDALPVPVQPDLYVPPTPDLDPEALKEAAKRTYPKVGYLSTSGIHIEFIRDDAPIGQARVSTEPVIGLLNKNTRIVSIDTDPSNYHSTTLSLLWKLASRNLYQELEVIEGLPGAKAGRVSTELALHGLMTDGWQLEPAIDESDDIAVVRHRFVKREP